MKPRPYQSHAITCIRDGFKEFRRQLAVLPTGSGKTIIFAWLAQLFLPLRTLILAHRDELIDQAIDKIKVATGIQAEKEKAESNASPHAVIVVASVQSMIRRLDRWPSDHFNLVVADEAHHAISESWQTVLNHFSGRVLGVTATPDRGDKRNLGEYFENVAVDIPLVHLIREGYLCPITVKSVPLKIDLSKVHLLAGDFADKELGSILEPYLATIAGSIRAHASFRKVLAFLPLIDTSHKFVKCCRQVGLKAEHIDGGSPDRKEILKRFSAGEFDILSNAMLLTEGFDDPSIDCIVVLRPTKSRPLFAQMVGRGTRIEPLKENLLLLDFLWLHERHRIVHPADLLAKDAEEADIITELAQERSKGCFDGEQLDLINLLGSATQVREQKLREKLVQLANRKAKYISAEEFCIQHHAIDEAFYEPTMKWESEAITKKQMRYIKEAKIDPETIKGRGHASALLSVLFKNKDLELAPNKQRWVMAQEGHPNAWLATRAEARRFFAQRNRNKS
jgi:superfamily II DNA or RNA helicase